MAVTPETEYVPRQWDVFRPNPALVNSRLIVTSVYAEQKTVRAWRPEDQRAVFYTWDQIQKMQYVGNLKSIMTDAEGE